MKRCSKTLIAAAICSYLVVAPRGLLLPGSSVLEWAASGSRYLPQDPRRYILSNLKP